MQTQPDPQEQWEMLPDTTPAPQIVEPYARLCGPHLLSEEFTREDGIALLRRVEWCARVSHRSEEAQGPDTWERFLRAVVLGHGDWSVVEHASATVDALVDRGVTHEWVRHRIGAAYTQESTRFVNYAKKQGARFIAPPGLDTASRAVWARSIAQSEAAYTTLLDAGHAPQIARSVFPTALASRLVVTYNLRAWRHFLLMRTTKETHPQMRQVTIPLLQQFQERIPLLFDDIHPEARQADNLARAR